MEDSLPAGVLPGFSALVGACAGFLFGRLAEIAGERRAGYAAAAARLLDLWQEQRPTVRKGFAGELIRLVIGNDPDLFAPIDALADAILADRPDATDRLVDLIESMRRSSVLGNVRYRYLGGGPSRRALIAKLIEFGSS